MKFFADYHHGGAARGIFLTFAYRLGHEVFFPDHTFADWANNLYGEPGKWLAVLPNTFKEMGGVPQQFFNEDGTFPNIINREQFLSTDWDAVFVTRTESQKIFKQLLQEHPNGSKIKVIGSMGNENTVFEWDWVKNFMVSDYLSFCTCPSHVNKIHYSQEMGTQFAEENKQFVPIKEEDLKTITTFINCLSSFTGPWHWDSERTCWHGKCPHCDGDPDINKHGPISPYGIWTHLKDKLPNHKFMDFGINNTGGMLRETEMPEKYHKSALTWHFKTYDGYGYSLLQSVAMGRLVIVPRRFHRYRTAGRYLINNLTCLEADWSPDSIKSVIEYFTADLDRANKYSEACFNAAKTLFNWELEAFRLKEFVETLR